MHIPRRREAARELRRGKLFYFAHFGISPRGLIHIHARARALRLRNVSVPVVVPVSLRFKHGLLIAGLTPSLIPLSPLIPSLNEDKYYLQYGTVRLLACSHADRAQFQNYSNAIRVVFRRDDIDGVPLYANCCLYTYLSTYQFVCGSKTPFLVIDIKILYCNNLLQHLRQIAPLLHGFKLINIYDSLYVFI